MEVLTTPQPGLADRTRAAIRAGVTTMSESVVTMTPDAHLDYLTLLGNVPNDDWIDEEAVLSTVGLVLFDEPDPALFSRVGPVRRWECLYAGPSGSGVTVCFGNRHAGSRWAETESYKVELKGTAFENVTRLDVFELRAALHDLGGSVRVDRLDQAWDQVGFGPGDVALALQSGDVRTPARMYERIGSESGRVGERGEGFETVYLGSRAQRPDRLLRVYEKPEFVRCEIELHRERADYAFAVLVGVNEFVSDDQYQEAAKGVLLDFVDFVEASSGSGNISRADVRLSWWGAFIDQAVRIRQVIPRTVRSLARTIQWLDRSVVRALAMTVKSMDALGRDGSAWLELKIDQAGKHLNVYQKSVVAACRGPGVT